MQRYIVSSFRNPVFFGTKRGGTDGISLQRLLPLGLLVFDQLNFIRMASYDASNTTNSILTSSLALTPAFPGGLIPKSVCFTVVSPV